MNATAEITECCDPTEVGGRLLAWLESHQAATDQVAKLTPRQIDFLNAMADHCWETKAASEAIGISPKTGEIHWANARAQLGEKLTALNSTELAVFWTIWRLTSPRG